MSPSFLSDPRFYLLLLAIDRDLAATARGNGCGSCGGALHVANYPRSPWGGLKGKAIRLSFCCAAEGCRKRCTPGSVRFLGRKFYLGVIVVLASVIYHGLTARRRDRLTTRLGVSERTLVRWRRWWLKEFSSSKFWRAMGGWFSRPVETCALPGSLLERFEGDEQTRVVAALRFLAPIAGGKGLAVQGF